MHALSSISLIVVAVASGVWASQTLPHERTSPGGIPSVIVLPSYPSEQRHYHVECKLRCAISVSNAGTATLDQCTGHSITATLEGPREIGAISNDFLGAIREAVEEWKFPQGAAGKQDWEFHFQLLPKLGKDGLTLPLSGPILSEVRLPNRIVVRAKRKEIFRSH